MSKPKSNKVNLTLYVDKNIVELAKRYIKNLSAFFEIKVLEYLKLGKINSSGPGGIRTLDLRLVKATS